MMKLQDNRMKILFVNPNTTEEFTKRISDIASRYASLDTEVAVMTASYGPRSIESIYDELLSSMGTLDVLLSNMDKYDGFVIACYSDHPTIYALREVTDKPVLGIAEASMYMASMLGHKFSVVTTNEEWEPLLWDAVRHYGLADRCASVRSTGMAVLALESASPEETYQMILAASKDAIELDGAEVICLGCAGMTGLDKKLETELNVPVIDGVVGALKLIEGMVGYGVHTSKRKAYATPGAKELVGIPPVFSKPYRKVF
jgi:allantoin racemase